MQRLSQGGIQVFYPDHGRFDLVFPPQLFQLPTQFYAMPFLAHRMELGAITPISNKWSEASKFYFMSRVMNKVTYAYIVPNNTEQDAQKKVKADLSSFMKPLEVHLIDTSGEEDEVIGELLCLQGYARRP
ncbi:uncharacterized protein LOC106012777 [Aplysia californica]|uniref:Uncharacterized protein LOC106012777 n=1 Tax=Aplysia californica TaxID=6500 RepID=A0ABM1A754_APLCA|nr:uncharacterized protein LOC106012777 [Aplysia californica]